MEVQRRDEIATVVKIDQKLYRRFHDVERWQTRWQVFNSYGWDDISWKAAELEIKFQAINTEQSSS